MSNNDNALALIDGVTQASILAALPSVDCHHSIKIRDIGKPQYLVELLAAAVTLDAAPLAGHWLDMIGQSATLTQPQRIAAATVIADGCRELWQKHNQRPEWLERAMQRSESAPINAYAEFAEDMARDDALDEAQQRRTRGSCDR